MQGARSGNPKDDAAAAKRKLYAVIGASNVAQLNTLIDEVGLGRHVQTGGRHCRTLEDCRSDVKERVNQLPAAALLSWWTREGNPSAAMPVDEREVLLQRVDRYVSTASLADLNKVISAGQPEMDASVELGVFSARTLVDCRGEVSQRLKRVPLRTLRGICELVADIRDQPWLGIPAGEGYGFIKRTLCAVIGASNVAQLNTLMDEVGLGGHHVQTGGRHCRTLEDCRNDVNEHVDQLPAAALLSWWMRARTSGAATPPSTTPPVTASCQQVPHVVQAPQGTVARAPAAPQGTYAAAGWPPQVAAGQQYAYVQQQSRQVTSINFMGVDFTPPLRWDPAVQAELLQGSRGSNGAAPAQPYPPQPNDAHARNLTTLYWNHGGTKHSQLPEGTRHTAEDKLHRLLGPRLRQDQPDVVVVAEMKSKTGRRHLETVYGYKQVVGRYVNDDEVAVFVRAGLGATFVHDGRRWITVDVQKAAGGPTIRVTGVHLYHKKKAPIYPVLVAHGAPLNMPFVILGDFNRVPAKVLPGLPLDAFVFSASARDHLVASHRLSVSPAAITVRELEESPHPLIAATLWCR